MGKISRNPEFYSVGIPLLFFFRVDNVDDPQAVDMIALLRAYNGIVNVANGRVLNTADYDTCLTPEEMLEEAYVGNITSNTMGGEINSIEHVASAEGRKEVDKVVLTRRSLTYTMGFDEMNQQNLMRFFAAQEVVYPTSEVIAGYATAKAPRAAAGDYAVDAIEVVSTGITAIGTNSSAFELLVTDTMKKRGANFAPLDVGGTDYYPGGVFYFMVGNVQQYPDVDTALEPYRNKLLCGYFVYDPASGEMKLQAWPANMNTAAATYAVSSFDNRIRVFALKEAETSSGVTTNDRVLDFNSATAAMQVKEWAFNASDVNTHTFVVELPKNVSRNSIRVTVKGKTYSTGAGVWQDATESLYDAPSATLASALESPVVTGSATQSYFTDDSMTKIHYSDGKLTFVAGAQLVLDGTTNNLEQQTLSITVSAYCAEDAHLAWTGIIWARYDDALSMMRVNRGKPEVSGCALIVFQNSVGVSFIHAIPRCTLRPDGSIDYAKDDWLAGSFVLNCIKDDSAYMPNLPKRLRTPYGFTITYRYRAVGNI